MERIEGGRHQRATTPKPAPPAEPWWSKHFFTLVLLAAAAAGVWYFVGGSSNGPSGPGPAVEFAALPVVTSGLTCDADAGTLQIIRTDSAIRNVGTEEARSVVQWPVHAVTPDAGSDPAFPLPSGTCSGAPPSPMPAVSLSANATLNQFLAPEKTTFTPVPKTTRLKLHTTVCVTYTNAAGAPFGTCTTYRFVPSDGSAGFTCDASVKGAYRVVSSERCGK